MTDGHDAPCLMTGYQLPDLSEILKGDAFTVDMKYVVPDQREKVATDEFLNKLLQFLFRNRIYRLQLENANK